MSVYKARVAVSGAGRGLGFAFVSQLSQEPSTQVLALRRTHTEQLDRLAEERGNVVVVDLELTSHESIVAAAKECTEVTAGVLDMLINCAGFLPPGNSHKVSELMDVEMMKKTMDINLYGHIVLTNHLLPLLHSGRQKRIINITSRNGSFSHVLLEEPHTNWAEYRYSKVALNMATVDYAAELASEGFTIVAICPGWCNTGMGGEGAEHEPEDSVASMLAKVEHLTTEDSGRFFAVRLDLSVKEHPW